MGWKLWVCIGVIVVLVGSTGYLAFAYTGKSSDLTEANSAIDDYIDEVADLEDDVTDLTDDLSAMTSERDTLEDEKADLENELSDANSEISSLESSLSSITAELNSERARTTSLQGELNTVKYPRHFYSIQELMDWLNEDDTSEHSSQYSSYAALAYAVQVRALQDGYILNTDVDIESDGIDYWALSAVIGDTIYMISALDDSIIDSTISNWFEEVPTYPIPQGQ